MASHDKFDDLLEQWMADPDWRHGYEKLEPAYQVIRLRTIRGLSQKQLADLVGTTQSSIARLESGGRPPSISFLRKVVEAMGGRLVISAEPVEDIA